MELLVVVGIIAVLMGMLLPTLLGARKQAVAVQCASNLRTICAGLLCYASENRGAFPPNGGISPAPYWYDLDRVGGYLSRGKQGSAALACPADADADRSYSMNVWASSRVDNPKGMEGLGKRWASNVKDASRMILAAESWSGIRKSLGVGFTAEATMGLRGLTAGQKFGAGGGLPSPPTLGRWGTVLSELPYWRHRKMNGISVKEPMGQVNIGYADGHVAMKAEWELADFQTGRSTLNSLWTPEDAEHNGN